MRRYLTIGVFVSLGLIPLYQYLDLFPVSASCAVYAVLGFWGIRRLGKPRADQAGLARLFLLLTLGLILVGNHFGKEALDGRSWLVFFPFIAYTLTSSREGLYWSAGATLSSLLVQLLVTGVYSTASILIFAFAMLTTAALCYAFVRHSELDSEALRNSEEQIRAIVESTKDWIWAIDLEGAHTYSNPAVEEILGHTVDEVIGTHYLDLMHEDDRAEVEAHFGDWIAKKQGWNNLVIRWRHKEGGYRHLESNAVPRFDADGKLAGFRGVDRDISERKQTESALRESEERFSLFMDHLPAIAFIKDEESRTLYVNKHMNDVLGAKDWIGLSAMELFPGEVGAAMIRDDRKAMAKGYEMIVETVPDREGVPRVYQTHKFRIERSGNPPYLGGIALDITELKRAEEALHQAAAVYENTIEGIVITDTRDKIVAVNKAVTEITGFTETEAVGRNPDLWKSDRHDPSFFQNISASLEQTGQWQGEIWNRRKNGEAFPCWQTITAIRDEAGDVTHHVSLISDITSIKESQARLEHLAHHDPLTGLPNRVLFNARLEHALASARRDRQRVGVMFLDLDNFKPINDGLGHPVGDKVLQLVAARLHGQVREKDTVARLAGDEFAILLEEISDTQGIAYVAGKVLSTFEQPFRIDGQELHLTMTVGISLYPDDGADVHTLLKNADAAMYRAKERGKNRYSFYTHDLTRAALDRLRLENELRTALKRNEFRVRYQPQYSLATGRLTGAEALLCWQHPHRGLVAPAQFIPATESIGLIIPLGEWVLRQACAQAKAWRDAGHGLAHIGVNVAGQQLQRSKFAVTVGKVLKETGLEPQCLELEITESFIMQQAEEAINVLEALRDMGVSLSIDDFGTGYSSLSYLKRLPIDKLKVDQSFVEDIPQDPNDRAITKAIIALGKSLQLKVIAEGVETEAQRTFLAEAGCDEAQGYYFSPPVAGEAFTGLREKTV